MGTLRLIAWVLTLLGSVLGGITLLSGLFSATGAPQQAAAAAVAVSFVVLPYCCARALSELGCGSGRSTPVPEPPIPRPRDGLIECRACQRSIRADSPTCPHCGAPEPSLLLGPK